MNLCWFLVSLESLQVHWEKERINFPWNFVGVVECQHVNWMGKFYPRCWLCSLRRETTNEQSWQSVGVVDAKSMGFGHNLHKVSKCWYYFSWPEEKEYLRNLLSQYTFPIYSHVMTFLSGYPKRLYILLWNSRHCVRFFLTILWLWQSR